MKPTRKQAFMRLVGISILFITLVAIGVAIIGRVNGWNTSLPYSNAFFVVGVLVGGGGIADRFFAQRDYERSSRNLVFVCLSSGVGLILISVLVSKLF